MNEWILFSIGIISIIAGLAVVFVYKMSKKGWKHQTDYKAFFIMGVTWFPLGIVLDMPFFYVLGLVYMIIGLANRDKWGKKQRITKKQMRMKMIAVFLGVVILAISLIVLLLWF
jgi:hypothetical protein